MRGAQLFQEIFKSKPQDSANKKRSTRLLSLRNECLIARFYYYGNFTDKRYEFIINLLSEEFFLTVVTIPIIIKQNHELLVTLKKANPQKKNFEKKYPWLNWD